MGDLLRTRHAVEGVDRHPVPALHGHRHAVHDERPRPRELDLPEPDGDLSAAHLDRVETLLAQPVRPPELRLVDAEHDLAVDLDHAGAVDEPHVREDLRRSAQRHRAPDALVDHPRAEVPAVAHPALVGADTTRPPDLRLARRRRVDDHREQVPARRNVDRKRRERPLVARHLLPVNEDGGGVVDAGELDASPFPVDSPPVDPGPLRHPLGEAAVALAVEVGNLAGPHQVVEDAAGNARRQPPRRVPGLVRADMPLPFVTEASAHLPGVAVESDHHSSRLVSATAASGSRGTLNVLIWCAPKSASIVRSTSGSSIVARTGRPAVS
jgi:hypothetical protein